jgi:transcriptional antiterminator RfaH
MNDAQDIHASEAQSHDGTSGQCWYVAYTKPRQEHSAVQNLQRQGFHTYMPLYKAVQKQPRTAAAERPEQPATSQDGQVSDAQVVYQPMFPRYVFLRPARPQQSLATVRSTRGVNNLVRFGPELATLQPNTLDAIQLLEQQRNEAPLQTISPFQPGKRVRLCEPGLNTLEGLVHSVSAKRVTILLQILGRQKTLRVEHGQLELVD